MSDYSRKLFVDLTEQRLVGGSKNAGAAKIVQPYHQNKLYLEVQPLLANPGGGEQAPFTVVSGDNYSLTVALFKASDLSTLAGPVTAWTPDPDGTALLGLLSLATTPMNAEFTGAATYVDTILEFKFEDSNTGSVYTIQQTLKVLRQLITAGTPSALPVTEYALKSDLSQYVRFTNNPDGASIELIKGVFKRDLRVGDQGEFLTDPVS